MSTERKTPRLLRRDRRVLRAGTMLAILAFTVLISAGQSYAAAKYVFLFIGDGMGAAQRNAAEMYMAGLRRSTGDGKEREFQLLMNSMPVTGMIRTNSMSGITDSAAAGTALAAGKKTTNGAVAMNPKTGERYDSLATLARRRGMRVGIITSSFLQDATPAVFYGHAAKRTEHQSLARQLAESGFEYFAGGGFRNPSKASKSAQNPIDLAKSKGYRVVQSAEGLGALAPGERAIASHPGISSGMMPWVIDERPGPSLRDYVVRGIELLDCGEGFFMMVEGGKIDLACHANDAAAAVREVIAFDEALAPALELCRSRPGESLVVVTSDHETGGMSLALGPDESELLYGVLSRQSGSHQAFERTISPASGAGIESGLARAEKFFGVPIGATQAVREAWRFSMTAKGKRPSKSPEYKKQYGPYDPFTVSCMRETNAAAGITWRTFYHTGSDVPVSAMGAGAGSFSGEYENSGIFDRLRAAMSL